MVFRSEKSYEDRRRLVALHESVDDEVLRSVPCVCEDCLDVVRRLAPSLGHECCALRQRIRELESQLKSLGGASQLPLSLPTEAGGGGD